jgi:hypothetical protein
MAYTGSLRKHDVGPLDPYAYTGPTRVMAGVARTGDVVLDTPYGLLGAAEFARWLYVGVTGNVSYVKWDGTSQTLVGLAAGVWHPIYSLLVNSVGTTATSIVWGS